MISQHKATSSSQPSPLQFYLDQLDPAGDEAFVEAYKKYRTLIASKLLSIFEHLKPHFQTSSSLQVLSLGCGIPDDYLALRAFCDKHYGKDFPLTYVGVDIDSEHNAALRSDFKNFPQLSLLTADGSNSEELLKLLTQNKLLSKEGFNLIFLRQPDVLTKGSSRAFLKMVAETIPTVASLDSRVFISCYHEKEIMLVREYLDPQYYYTPSQSYLQLQQGIKIQFDKGPALELDSYNVMLHCRGLAFQLTQKKPSPKSSHETPQGTLPCLSLINISPHRQLLLEAEKLCKARNECATYLKAIKEEDYSLALHQACLLGSLPLVLILLKYRLSLSFDINKPSSSNGWTALDWIENAEEVVPVIKEAIVKNLLSHHAKRSNELLDAKKPEQKI